jgi:arylsulfatase A-like enzyme
VNQGLLEWLEGRDPGRPFFAFVNYFDAHHPYIPITEASSPFGGRAPSDPWIDYQKTYQPDEIDALRDAYDQCILDLDAEVGRLIGRLQERGHLENTVVIVTSDHGEHFGEHGLMGHACSLYTPLLHVPLIILYPSRVPAGEVFTQPVSLRDLPATIVDLVGLMHQDALPGHSLTGLWQAERHARKSWDPQAFSELYPSNMRSMNHARAPVFRGPMKSLVWRDYHYIRNGDGIEELYHLAADPHEENNLAASAGGKAVIERLRHSLDAARSTTK